MSSFHEGGVFTPGDKYMLETPHTVIAYDTLEEAREAAKKYLYHRIYKITTKLIY